MSVSLLLAVLADRAIRGATTYKTLIIWPYAVAPIVSAVLWFFLFNPTVGMIAHFLKDLGLIEEKEVLADRSRGLFLHDFGHTKHNSLRLGTLFEYSDIFDLKNIYNLSFS